MMKRCCDKCGKEIKSHNYIYVDIYVTPQWNDCGQKHDGFDYCPDCFDSMKEGLVKISPAFDIIERK